MSNTESRELPTHIGGVEVLDLRRSDLLKIKRISKIDPIQELRETQLLSPESVDTIMNVVYKNCPEMCYGNDLMLCMATLGKTLDILNQMEK